MRRCEGGLRQRGGWWCGNGRVVGLRMPHTHPHPSWPSHDHTENAPSTTAAVTGDAPLRVPSPISHAMSVDSVSEIKAASASTPAGLMLKKGPLVRDENRVRKSDTATWGARGECIRGGQ